MSGGVGAESDLEGLVLVRSVWPVSRETSDRLERYVALLRQWQPRINLVSPSTMDAIWTRHIADSLQTFVLKPEAKHWIDLGSGAGFPGLVTAVMLAEADGGRVDLVESNGKKCAFLRAVVREIGFRDLGVEVNVHQGRIEAVLPELPKPDVISARALASLDKLLWLTSPYFENQCVGLFSKGRDHEDEIVEAQSNWLFSVKQHDSRFGDESVLLEISEVQPV